jgi:hypothetical protein
LGFDSPGQLITPSNPDPRHRPATPTQRDAAWAQVPVAHGERVLGLSIGFGVTGEEAMEECVGGGSEGVNGKGPDRPAEGGSEGEDPFAQPGGADWAGDVGCGVARQIVDTLVDESLPRSVQMQSVASNGPF